MSGEAAQTLQQLQSQLEAVPQPRQSTSHSHRLCWALAPPGHPAANGEQQRFPDNCIDGGLLVRCAQGQQGMPALTPTVLSKWWLQLAH